MKCRYMELAPTGPANVATGEAIIGEADIAEPVECSEQANRPGGADKARSRD
jgi:hypothetical protein